MASGKPRRRPERGADAITRATQKAESAAAELRKKADQLDALTERFAHFDVWTRPEPGSRRPRFTRDEIARAALRIADTEGFDALSMRRLAAELDAGTMTLYHYVKTKDELLSLVNDAVMAEVLVPDGQLPTDWRPAVTMIATRSRDALRRHPWSLDIRDDPGPGPNGVRHFDQSMQAVRSLPLTLGERFELVTAVDEYVFGFCMAERANVGFEGTNDPTIAYVQGLMGTGDYPMLTEIAVEHGVTGAFDVLRHQLRDPDRFGRNLARLLDGFEAGMRRR
jgi:AcrR family transcriptional regulator